MTSTVPLRERVLRLALYGAIFALVAFLVFAPGLPSFCPMRVLFHLPCPSCGMTRALKQAAVGDFAAASSLHPLWPLVLPAGLVLGTVEALGYLRRGTWGTALERRPVQSSMLLLLALLFGVWLARFAGAFGGPAPIAG